jgi:hypothetical protein
VERIQESLQVPGWAWLAIGAIAIFLITRLHEGAVHLADRFFNRALDAAELELGAAMLNAKEPARDRPASGAGAVPKAQSDLGRLVSSGRTKVREGKKAPRDGTAPRQPRSTPTRPCFARSPQGRRSVFRTWREMGRICRKGSAAPFSPYRRSVRCAALRSRFTGPIPAPTSTPMSAPCSQDSPPVPRLCMPALRTASCAARSRGLNASLAHRSQFRAVTPHDGGLTLRDGPPTLLRVRNRPVS